MSESRIGIIDDHPLLASGLAAELNRLGAEAVLLDVATGVEALLEAADALEPTCLVVDLGLPLPGGGAALVPALVTRGHRVVVLTGETEQWRWAQALQGGAEVVVSKAEDLGQIVETVLAVAAGRSVRVRERATLLAEHQQDAQDRMARRQIFDSLTRREAETLAGLMAGEGVQRLAEKYFVSVETVRTQVKNVLRKLQVGSQLEAVALAHSMGWEHHDNGDA